MNNDNTTKTENEVTNEKLVNGNPRKAKDFDKTEFDILWQGKPSGLIQSFLTKVGLNFTTYQISTDELIVIKGFFKRRLNTCELYLLKDPDLTDNLYQRMLDISTITVRVSSATPNNNGDPFHKIIKLKNIKEGDKVRKLLRDAIEDDVMERKITYLDRV